MRKVIFFLSIIFFLLFISIPTVKAKSGCCSSHGGVCCSCGPQANGKVICNDGWRRSSCYYSKMVMCVGYAPSTPKPTSIPTLKPIIVSTPKVTLTPTLTPISTPTEQPTSSPTVMGTVTLEVKGESTETNFPAPTENPDKKIDESSNNSGGGILALLTFSGIGYGIFRFLKKKSKERKIIT